MSGPRKEVAIGVPEDALVYTVSKADATVEPITPAILFITGDLPQSRLLRGSESEWVREARAMHRGDAERVMNALLALPQGTLDQVLILLLERKATILRVPVFPATTENPREAVD